MKGIGMVLCVLLLGLAGCNGTPQERLDGLTQFLGMAQQQSEAINDDIESLQGAIADLKKTAADPGLSPDDAEKIQTALNTASEKLSAAIGTKQKVDAAIAQAHEAIGQIAAEGNANVGDEIMAAGAAITATAQAVPPPYGVYLGIIGSIIGAVGGVIAKRKTAALTDTVKSVDAAKQTLTTEQSAAFTASLKNAQTNATRDQIRKIRAA